MKSKTCPTAATLLLYGEASLEEETHGEIGRHLAHCDFCGAELQLLTKFPPRGRATFRPARMPLPLFRLAKDLLRLAAGDVERIYERASLTLTDA
jgi:hypothetical protein